MKNKQLEKLTNIVNKLENENKKLKEEIDRNHIEYVDTKISETQPQNDCKSGVELKVVVVECADVPKRDNNIDNSLYVQISLSTCSQKWKTKSKRYTSSPVFNQQFIIPITNKLDDILTVEIYDNGGLISKVVIQVNKIICEKELDSWFTMHPSLGFKTGGKLRLILLLKKIF